MRFGLTFAFLAVIFLCSCDNEISGSASSETIPRQIDAGCAMDQDLAHSDCAAIDIANICDPFLCRVATGQLIEDEITFATDYTLPECERDCRAMDCTTIECINSNIYTDLNLEIDQDGQISVSGILNDETVFTCLTRTSCGQ